MASKTKAKTLSTCDITTEPRNYAKLDAEDPVGNTAQRIYRDVIHDINLYDHQISAIRYMSHAENVWRTNSSGVNPLVDYMGHDIQREKHKMTSPQTASARRKELAKQRKLMRQALRRGLNPIAVVDGTNTDANIVGADVTCTPEATYMIPFSNSIRICLKLGSGKTLIILAFIGQRIIPPIRSFIEVDSDGMLHGGAPSLIRFARPKIIFPNCIIVSKGTIAQWVEHINLYTNLHYFVVDSHDSLRECVKMMYDESLSVRYDVVLVKNGSAVWRDESTHPDGELITPKALHDGSLPSHLYIYPDPAYAAERQIIESFVCANGQCDNSGSSMSSILGRVLNRLDQFEDISRCDVGMSRRILDILEQVTTKIGAAWARLIIDDFDTQEKIGDLIPAMHNYFVSATLNKKRSSRVTKASKFGDTIAHETWEYNTVGCLDTFVDNSLNLPLTRYYKYIIASSSAALIAALDVDPELLELINAGSYEDVADKLGSNVNTHKDILRVLLGNNKVQLLRCRRNIKFLDRMMKCANVVGVDEASHINLMQIFKVLRTDNLPDIEAFNEADPESDALIDMHESQWHSIHDQLKSLRVEQENCASSVTTFVNTIKASACKLCMYKFDSEYVDKVSILRCCDAMVCTVCFAKYCLSTKATEMKCASCHKINPIGECIVIDLKSTDVTDIMSTLESDELDEAINSIPNDNGQTKNAMAIVGRRDKNKFETKDDADGTPTAATIAEDIKRGEFSSLASAITVLQDADIAGVHGYEALDIPMPTYHISDAIRNNAKVAAAIKLIMRRDLFVGTKNMHQFIPDTADYLIAGKDIVEIPTGGQRKWIIVASSSSVLETLRKYFESLGTEDSTFPVWKFGGSQYEQAGIILAFRECAAPLSILLINCSQFSSGMNVQFATDMLLLHDIKNDAHRLQICGRIIRAGRTSSASIHTILFESEA